MLITVEHYLLCELIKTLSFLSILIAHIERDEEEEE